uniref:NADH dehydrogenase subunit 6 n=1 Tax=Pselaphanus sp. QL-2013 TaxID=1421598 RepID=A0A0A6ZKW2_9HYME|nr:NADH dehydrogenase subunit 6 [Pselaphanus sp. QL-2013]
MMIFLKYFNLFFINFLMLMILILPSHLFQFNPLFYSLMLLIYSIMIILKLNMFNNNYWYSYILFLIMIGGVLILFMYLTSVSNNEIFYINFKYIIIFLMKLFLLFFIMYFMLKFVMINMNIFSTETLDLMKLNMNIYWLFKYLYMNNFFMLNMFIILYLLMMMIISVMICLKNKMPMRQMMN